MKKMKYLLATLFVGALTLTGCGSKKNNLTAEETAKKVANSYEAVENYRINLDSGIKAKINDTEYNITLNGDADIDVKNGLGKVVFNADAMGEKLKIEMFAAYNSSKQEITLYVKNPNGDEWAKVKTSAKEFNVPTISTIDAEKLYKQIFESKALTQVDPDNDNYNYEMLITPENLKSAVNEAITQVLAYVGQDKLDSNTKKVIEQYLNLIKGNIKIELSLDKEKFNFTKFKVDIKDMASQTISALAGGSEGFNLSRADFSIKITDFGKVGTITIPSEALNAQDVSSEVTSLMQ